MCNVWKEEVFFSSKINSNLNQHNIHKMPTSSEASRTGSGAGGGGGGGAGGGGMNPNTKAPAANGKNYHWWQKFCKSRLVLYFPFTICVNPLRWWFVWMSESFNLKGGARKASYFVTALHDGRNQQNPFQLNSLGKFRRSLIFTLEVVEIRSLSCLHSLAAYEEPYLAMAEMVGTSPFSNKRYK